MDLNAIFHIARAKVDKKLGHILRKYIPEGPEYITDIIEEKNKAGKTIKKEDKYIVIQSISWVDGDFEDNPVNHDDDGGWGNLTDGFEDSGKNKYAKKEYQIIATGICNERSITVRIKGYRPFFFIQVPGNYGLEHKKKIVAWVKKECWNKGVLEEECKLLERKTLYPYTEHTKYKFIKLVFDSVRTFKAAIKVIKGQKPGSSNGGLITIPGVGKDLKFKTFETRVCMLNKFCHEKDVTTTGFIKIKNFTMDEDLSTTEYRICVDAKDVFKAPDSTVNSNFRVLSYDIETYSSREDQFPDANIRGDFIGQIGISMLYFKTKVIEKILICKGRCNPIDGVTIFECESEEELLILYAYLVSVLDPDIITGYNIWNFDDKYVRSRIKLLGLDDYMKYFSRIKLTLGELGLFSKYKLEWELKKSGSKNKKKEYDNFAEEEDFVGIVRHTMVSPARGENTFYILTMPGRESIDLIENIKQEHKLDSYKLDFVGNEFIGDHKEDITVKQLFEYMSSGNADLMRQVGVYCIQDTNLVIKLVQKLLVLQNYIEMSKITFVPLSWLSIRGQQCKVFSLVVKNAKENGYVVPDILSDEVIREDQRNYEGALVLEPKSGTHGTVMCMDFASLYPSIMRAFNIDLSTIVKEDIYRLKKTDGQVFETIAWTDKNTGMPFSYTFAQHNEDPETRGIVPKILDNLAKWRKETKKLMNDSTDQDIKNVYDSKQLSIKIVMNSIYGFFGSRNVIACTPIAASVTARGRDLLRAARKIAEEKFRGDVLYGDSIPGYEKVWINDVHDSIENHISDILHTGHTWTDYKMFKSEDSKADHSTKQQINFCDHNNVLIRNEYITETGSGKAAIRRIIRHKTSKKLYRIVCKDSEGNLSSIVVTEGHSLIDTTGKPIPVDSLKIGMKLP